MNIHNFSTKKLVVVLALVIICVSGSGLVGGMDPPMGHTLDGDPVQRGGPYTLRDSDWNYWSNTPDMYALPAGNVGIGGVPPSDAKFYVKSEFLDWKYGLYTESDLGIKSVSTAMVGTGITGEGGHAGVHGNGFIGILGSGFYGGWFQGHGVFEGNVGINIQEPVNALHIDGAIQLEPIPEPTSPSTGFIIYCDEADGALKTMDQYGSTSILAEPHPPKS